MIKFPDYICHFCTFGYHNFKSFLDVLFAQKLKKNSNSRKISPKLKDLCDAIMSFPENNHPSSRYLTFSAAYSRLSLYYYLQPLTPEYGPCSFCQYPSHDLRSHLLESGRNVHTSHISVISQIWPKETKLKYELTTSKVFLIRIFLGHTAFLPRRSLLILNVITS